MEGGSASRSIEVVGAVLRVEDVRVAVAEGREDEAGADVGAGADTAAVCVVKYGQLWTTSMTIGSTHLPIIERLGFGNRTLHSPSFELIL